MKENFGIDMSCQYSKLISDIPAPDIVITMGCNVQCPNIPCKECYDWGFDDPTGKSDEEFIKTANKRKYWNYKNNQRGVCYEQYYRTYLKQKKCQNI